MLDGLDRSAKGLFFLSKGIAHSTELSNEAGDRRTAIGVGAKCAETGCGSEGRGGVSGFMQNRKRCRGRY
jgi:hypothetical protein